jgi:hypothetical protein
MGRMTITYGAARSTERGWESGKSVRYESGRGARKREANRTFGCVADSRRSTRVPR